MLASAISSSDNANHRDDELINEALFLRTTAAWQRLLGDGTHSRTLPVQLYSTMAHPARSKCVRTTIDAELMAQAAANHFGAFFPHTEDVEGGERKDLRQRINGDFGTAS